MRFNFKLLKNEYINDISSEGFIYEHISGAKLIFIKNADKNKVFSVTFKTLPENNKGVAHIMEHSVLCGSRKYPVKDPFNQLEKGSLNTYLNAMTFHGKTMYPVASTNEKDFINLMNVYMDSVFFPLIYERKGIFLQEGHHKEKGGINGVVYNEMKGAFSPPDKIIDFKLNEKLFENTNYRFYSGGVPEHICQLTYEEFIDFHKKYYHPSNSILYLYGDINIDSYLEILDRDYLSEFEFKDINIGYLTQENFNSIKDFEFNYDISDETAENKNYFQCGAIIGSGLDFKLSFAFEILTEALLETESSPLKKALIQNGIGDNIYGLFDDSMFQTRFSVSIGKTSSDDLEKFKKVYFETLNDIVKNGLNKKLIESCINKYKFYFKEEDYGYKPRGLFLNIQMLNSFIYGKGNFDGIKSDELFEYVENLNFEKLIEKYLLKNKNYVFALMKPQFRKDKENKSYEPDLEFEDYKRLEDSKENIEKIPLLNIEDIDKESSNIEIFEETICQRRLISARISNDDIVYINLLFDTRVFDIEDLKYFAIFKYIFGKINTKKYSYEELTNEINFYFGKFSASFESYSLTDDFLPVLEINMKFLYKNINNAFSIAKEVIFDSIFDKKRVKELLSEYKIIFEKSFVTNAHVYGIFRCMSYLSDMDKYAQFINGLDFYEFLKDIITDFDNKVDLVIEKLNKIKSIIFNKGSLIVGIVCGENNYNNVLKNVKDFCEDFDKFDFEVKRESFAKSFVNEAFVIESEVQYNVLAANYKKFSLEYSGKMEVIEKIISSDYLWNKIRLDGGAYGGGCCFLRRGLFYLYSYRDPNVKTTFEKYREISAYLRNINLSERELQKYIIGTINRLDKPLLISQVMEKILRRKISDITDEERQKERDDILNIKKSDILEFSEIFDKCFSESFICTFGGGSAIKKAETCFEKIYFI